MIKLKETFRRKDETSEFLLKEAFLFNNKIAPYIIFDTCYWIYGESQDNIPEGFFGDDPDVMLQYNLKKIIRHYETYSDDCHIGFLMPWFGTGVLASAFGTQVRFVEGGEPTVEMSSIKNVEEMDGLVLPDCEKDGLMPRVLKQIKYFKENCDLQIGITDCQGPLDSALSIIGYENFIYWAVDYPDRFHAFMDKVTTALIDWIRVQKKYIGDPDTGPAFICGQKIPEGFGGIWFAEDDGGIFSPSVYAEFIKPYNERVLTAFGGGGIHYCGNSNQNLDNYANTKGLTCLHNVHMDDFDTVVIAAKKMQNAGKAFFIVDVAPTEDRLSGYYDELFKRVDQRGLIVVSFLQTMTALCDKKYEVRQRDPIKIGKAIEDLIVQKRKLYSY